MFFKYDIDGLTFIIKFRINRNTTRRLLGSLCTNSHNVKIQLAVYPASLHTVKKPFFLLRIYMFNPKSLFIILKLEIRELSCKRK